MTHNGKLLLYVSKCTYFRPKMTNSRVDVNFLAGGARNYETKIRNPVDFGDNFKGFFHCSFREEGRRRRRKKTNFYWISPFFFSLVPSLPKLLPPLHPYPRSFSKCSKRKIAGGIALKPRSDHHLGPKIYLQRYLTAELEDREEQNSCQLPLKFSLRLSVTFLCSRVIRKEKLTRSFFSIYQHREKSCINCINI